MDKKEVSREFNKLFSPSAFSIPKISPAKKIEDIKREFSNFRQGDDYSVSGDIYFVYSEVMKSRLRDIVWERVSGKSQEVEGYFFNSDVFSCKHSDVKNSPDEFVLIESGIDNSPKLIGVNDEEAEKIRQENSEITETENSTNLDSETFDGVDRRRDKEIKWSEKDDKLKTNHEKDNNHRSGEGGNKYAILPFAIGGGFFLCVIGIVLIKTRI